MSGPAGRDFIFSIFDNSPAARPMDSLYEIIKSKREDIINAAQKIYDSWEQDEEGIDEELGSGGICDRISSEIGNILAYAGVDTIDGGQDGDDHAYTIAYNTEKAYIVDIPHGVYETGGGYSWRKIPRVKFSVSDVGIWEIPVSDVINENEGPVGRFPDPAMKEVVIPDRFKTKEERIDYLKRFIAQKEEQIKSRQDWLNTQKVPLNEFGSMMIRTKQEAINRWIGEKNEAYFLIEELLGKKTESTPDYTPDQLKEFEKIIGKAQGILDEGKKSQTINQLENLIEDLPDDLVETKVDVQSAIEDYRGIEREGLTPEEYADEKQSAFEAIQEAVDSLEISQNDSPVQKKKEIFWVEPYDKDGKSFSASVVYSWKEALDTARFYRSEAAEQGYHQICIWKNRVDQGYGDQPDYSTDPEWMWKAEQ